MSLTEYADMADAVQHESCRTALAGSRQRRDNGAAVLADNIFTFWHALASYVAYVQDPSHGFCSVTLFLGDGMEYSVRL